jgi:5-(carboxyamino)imidazole ribonucleotide synthase
VADRPIGRYERRPARLRPWDPRSERVASRIAALVAEVRPEPVEHIGSTAIQGMPGKGIVDLSIEAEPAEIPGIVTALYGLGFQPQPGPDPFPPTRPMLVGAMIEDGEEFRVHLHVQPVGGDQTGGDHKRDIAFRDALRSDRELFDQYVALKAGITAGGEVDALQYTHSKTSWIHGVYRRIGYLPHAVLPPATIGILGGGQLGRMIGLAARELGYRVAVLDPDPDCPAAAVADHVELGGYDDVTAAERLAAMSGVITYELEHVGLDLVQAIDRLVPVRPGPLALSVTQDRLAERRFVERTGGRVAPWREATDAASVAAAGETLGFPLRLKAPTGGYDGRSQVRVADARGIPAALAALGLPPGSPVLVERELEFEMELSVVTARAVDGTFAPLPVARNVHDAGILVESSVPAPIPESVAEAAHDLGRRLAVAAGVVGTLTAELFLLPDGSLVVNELAPRVHNSGHWSIEASATSQFEQHVRAICALPLGRAGLRTPAAATVNLLGTGERRPAALTGLPEALALPDVHLHVYDKRQVFERRKMGHVTALADTPEEAIARASAAQSLLRWS